MTLRPAAFLDRDGTIVEDVGYARAPEQLTLLPGAREALARLRREGFVLVVVTNQSGIGRGYLTEADFAKQVERLGRLLGPEAAPDAHYHCPHHPTEAHGAYRVECDCRKPKPGLYIRAARELGLDPAASLSIGDAERDARAAAAAGVKVCVTLGEDGVETLDGAVSRALALVRA
jgi:D-glycero-D-manno-heptose 1,7-bisphosphate phosphatase